MRNVFIQFDSLRSLIYPRTKQIILRCNPSLLIVSKANHDFETCFSIYAKSPTDKYREMQIKRCWKKQTDSTQYVDSWCIENYAVKADVGLKILDITNLDYPWQYFKFKFSPTEEVGMIKSELQSVAQMFEFYGHIDGYLIEPNQYLFFKK